MENLNKKGRSKTTDFVGTITCFCAYATGTKSYQLTGKSIDGKTPEEYWTSTTDVEVLPDND